MIIDGRQIAREILAHASVRAQKLPHPPRVLALVANDTPATRSYLGIKQRRAEDGGCVLELRHFPQTVTQAELIAAAASADADAVLVQLPLPEGIDTQTVCDAVPLEKDADVLSGAAREAFERGDAGALLPPVVGAVAEVFARQGVDPRGKNAVIVGRGYLVGGPSAIWLSRMGAQVTILTAETPAEELAAALCAADIIVSGAGVPHLIQPDMLREHVVLVDAGTSESGGKVVGDADPACAERCALFTPVPGGVGPIAVAKLFENAVFLAERKIPFS